jgi:polyisoprenoid-binding protein YceI
MTTTTAALDGTYELDRVHSTLQFSVRHAGVSTFRGTFADLDAHLVVDGGVARLDAGTSVESISIAEPPEFREHVVHGSDFFAADDHPRISFQSTRLEFGPSGKVAASGVLEIRGVTRRVDEIGTFTPPTEDPFGNTRLGLFLRASVDRRGWGMDWQMQLPAGGDALGWDVEITALLELTKAG